MSYLALYRKYRPKTFDEVIGQNHITTTLVNQIKNNQIGHAYLFTGTRGTGKTTCAKVFARAINCLNPQNGSPCGECEVCKGLSSNTNMDILEIDAASNNRVDEIRELREKVKYPPVVGKYKVYIIDEVHMLTDSAFNALLKTLEEPPVNVVFILATTEVQKLPATILSRCMRFDFKLVGEDEVAPLVEKVLTSSGVTFDSESCKAIARAGEGSVRDALSIADMCSSFCNNNITYEKTLEVLGLSSKETLIELTNYLLLKDVNSYLTKLNEVLKNGKSVVVLNKDITNHLRDLIILKTCKDASKLITLPSDVMEKMKKQANEANIEKLVSCMQIFGSAENNLKFSINARITFETLSLSAILTDKSYSLDDINERIKLIEKKIETILKNE